MFEVMFWILVVLVALLIPVCIDLTKQVLKLEDRLRFSNKAHMRVIKQLARELAKAKEEASTWNQLYITRLSRDCEAEYGPFCEDCTDFCPARGTTPCPYKATAPYACLNCEGYRPMEANCTFRHDNPEECPLNSL